MPRAPEIKDGQVKTTVLLPEAVWRAAKIHAVETRRDLRGVIVAALEDYLRTAAKGGRR